MLILVLTLVFLYFMQITFYFPVLDVAAFERLLGPCMAIMSRNVDHYQKQVVELFGSEANISDLR